MFYVVEIVNFSAHEHWLKVALRSYMNLISQNPYHFLRRARAVNLPTTPR